MVSTSRGTERERVSPRFPFQEQRGRQPGLNGVRFRGRIEISESLSNSRTDDLFFWIVSCFALGGLWLGAKTHWLY